MNAVQEELLERMIQSGALLEGHFKLSSGLHSGNYLQCALLIQRTGGWADATAPLSPPRKSAVYHCGGCDYDG